MNVLKSQLPKRSAFDALHVKGGMSIGVEMPLDNDFSRVRMAKSTPTDVFGVPNLDRHRQRAVLVDELGFSALWLRDVPLWVPSFGDAGQVFDPFPYLGFLAGVTERVTLATAAVVLPLRHPVHVAKMAATIDNLADGRLVLGVASGDRPSEYPVFEREFDSRGEQYRDAVGELREIWQAANTLGANHGKVLPVTTAEGGVPLLAVGRSQQSTQWVADNMDGYVTYHRSGSLMKHVVDEWNDAVGEKGAKPVVTTMLVDLQENPDAALQPIRFGARLGRLRLLDYLKDLEDAGVSHVALNFRPSERPVEDALEEIAQNILPEFG